MRFGNIFDIMIGSPGDVIDIAKKAIDVINLWNVHNSEDKGIVLVPHHWTSSSYPSLRINSAQGVINTQLVEKCDALVAIFGSKLGTPTENHQSGTAEEIAEIRGAGKPVMVFFCKQIDIEVAGIEQVNKLHEYRKSIEGLYETYQDLSDFEKVFSQKLNLFVQNELQPLISEDVSNNTKREKVSFSEDEKKILRKWCAAKSNYLSITVLLAGNVIYSFSGHPKETRSPKESAKMEDFINRMRQAGLIQPTGVNKQGKTKYELTLLAYETFGDEL